MSESDMQGRIYAAAIYGGAVMLACLIASAAIIGALCAVLGWMR